MLKQEGWQVNHKRVERIWRKEGLKVSDKQPKRGRLWLNDSSCIRLRPEYKDHVWSYDFMIARTAAGLVVFYEAQTWWAIVGSNHRPQSYQDCALTN